MRVKLFGAAVMLFLDAYALNVQPMQEGQDFSQVAQDQTISSSQECEASQISQDDDLVPDSTQLSQRNWFTDLFRSKEEIARLKKEEAEEKAKKDGLSVAKAKKLTLVDDCDGSKDGMFVSWKPYVELLKFIKEKQSHRMTFYFFMDTEAGAIVEKQLLISLNEWTKKFQVLSKLPYEGSADESIALFSEVAKQNEIAGLIQNLLKETKDSILADMDKETNPKKAQKEQKEMVVQWEKLREFLNGLQRYKENLDSDDFDGSVKREALEKRRQEEADNAITTCWVASYWRGKGSLVDSCPKGKEAAREESDKPAQVKRVAESYSDEESTDQSGLLCYPPCKEGYSGLGPLCWSKCPDGFKNHGLWCYKPDGHWPEKQSDGEKVCREGFHKQFFGKWCSADCPTSMTDIGITCQKDSIGRGFGTRLGCSNGKNRSGLFCYDACQEGYEGTAALCFSVCREGSSSCGVALCVSDEDNAEMGCTHRILNMVKGVVKATLQTAKTIINTNKGIEDAKGDLGKIADAQKIPGQDNLDIANAFEEAIGNFVYPICKKFGLSRGEKAAIRLQEEADAAALEAKIPQTPDAKPEPTQPETRENETKKMEAKERWQDATNQLMKQNAEKKEQGESSGSEDEVDEKTKVTPSSVEKIEATKKAEEQGDKPKDMIAEGAAEAKEKMSKEAKTI